MGQLEVDPEIPNAEENGIAGFEGVYAITGLIAIAYLIRRSR